VVEGAEWQGDEMWWEAHGDAAPLVLQQMKVGWEKEVSKQCTVGAGYELTGRLSMLNAPSVRIDHKTRQAIGQQLNPSSWHNLLSDQRAKKPLCHPGAAGLLSTQTKCQLLSTLLQTKQQSFRAVFV